MREETLLTFILPFFDQTQVEEGARRKVDDKAKKKAEGEAVRRKADEEARKRDSERQGRVRMELRGAAWGCMGGHG